MKNYLQAGRSMIEMLGVLAVVGMLSVGGFSLVSKMQTSRKINDLIDETATLARKVRAVARDYEGETGIINNEIRDKKAYPESFSIDETESDTNNAFHGTDDVEFNIYYNNSRQVLFTLELKDVEEEICMELVTTNWGSTSSSGFVGLSVNESDYEKIANIVINNSAIPNNVGIAGNKDNPVPMGIGKAADLCSGKTNILLAFR